MKFLVCPISSVRIKHDWVFHNNPVAESAITGLARTRVNHYFNETGLPAIEFQGSGTKWVFKTLAEREAMLKAISSDVGYVDEELLARAAAEWSKLGLVADKTSGAEDWRKPPVEESK